MIRPQRRVHGVVWPLLGALLAIGIAAGLWARGRSVANGPAVAGVPAGVPAGVRP